MAVNPLNDNLRVQTGKHQDEKLGGNGGGVNARYGSTAAAIAAIQEFERAIGMTVLVDVGGTTTEYWWRDGVGDGDLIAKASTSGGYQLLNVPLGTNPTAVDFADADEVFITAMALTASTTILVGNTTSNRKFAWRITNTNANVLTFNFTQASTEFYFKVADLPSGVSWDGINQQLTFPADSAVDYNLVGVRFDGLIYDCKLEIR
jgi:hypothetical protein